MPPVERIVTRLDVFAGISVALLLAAAPLSAATDPAALPESAARSSTRFGDGVLQQGPEELRGEVASVSGDRIQIRLSQQEWLPRAGTAVDIGAEMSGIWVPLKGDFVIVQIDADAVAAMAVGDGAHGTPAAGMLAVIKTPYPNHPQSRADYIASREGEARVRPMAEGGDPLAQHLLAMGCESRGDHDGALAWWERSSKGSNDRVIVSRSALGRSKILAIRGDGQGALAILEDAASRTAPRADERVFAAYSTSTGADARNAVEPHVDVLKELGHVHRQAGDLEASRRWFRAAADVMAAAATSGTPGPDQPTYKAYLMLVNDLAHLYRVALEDEESAVPWLQIAARAGDSGAQATLTRLGRRW